MIETAKFSFLPLTLSMETLGGVASPIVRRGTPLPAKRKQQFSTTVDDQKAVLVEVYIGESPIVGNNIHIGKFEVIGIPDAPRGEAQIDIVFEVDEGCRIVVTATEKKTGKITTSDLQVPGEHLAPQRVEELLRKANDSRQEDKAKAQAIGERNSATALIHRAEKYLQGQQRSGFSCSTDSQIEEVLAGLGISLQQNDLNAIREKSNRLQQLLPSAVPGSLGGIFGGGGDIFGSLFGNTRPRPKRGAQPERDTQAGQKATASPKPKEAQSGEVAESKKGLFTAGQYFDAKCLVRDIFAQATASIVIIDGYVGEDVLNLLTVKCDTVCVRLLTGKVSQAFLTLARDFARQYKGLEVRSSKAFHDRFIIVDDKDFYHFGASLEHLGNKTFMFSKIEEPLVQAALQKQWNAAWDQATQIL